MTKKKNFTTSEARRLQSSLATFSCYHREIEKGNEMREKKFSNVDLETRQQDLLGVFY